MGFNWFKGKSETVQLKPEPIPAPIASDPPRRTTFRGFISETQLRYAIENPRPLEEPVEPDINPGFEELFKSVELKLQLGEVTKCDRDGLDFYTVKFMDYLPNVPGFSLQAARREIASRLLRANPEEWKHVRVFTKLIRGAQTGEGSRIFFTVEFFKKKLEFLDKIKHYQIQYLELGYKFKVWNYEINLKTIDSVERTQFYSESDVIAHVVDAFKSHCFLDDSDVIEKSPILCICEKESLNYVEEIPK